jgi:hypothetical protein
MNILRAMKPGGIGVLHFTYFNPGVHGFKGFIRKYLPFVRPLIMLLRGKKLMPEMQMNEYSLNEIVREISSRSSSHVHMEFSDHDGILGVVVYFRLD